MKARLLALGWGALFGTGLALSGMVQPEKVLGFLDVFGAWDASLLFVMGGALGVFAALRPLVLRRRQPVLGGSFPSPPTPSIDARLAFGAAVFGVGWGLAGYCPGPAVVAAGGGSLAALVVVLAMMLGIRLADTWQNLRSAATKVGAPGDACS